MKKLFALLAASVVTSSALFAQTTGVHFGLRGGLNLANIIKDGDNKYSTEMKPGFSGGAFLQLPLTKYISVQPEVMFSQKGYKSTGTFLTTNYDYRITTNFVEVPLLLKLSPSEQFSIVVGPQFSFLTSTHYNFKSGSASYEELVKEENDNYRKNTVGGVGGVEFNPSKNTVIGLRYALDFRSNKGDGTSTTPTYKNQVFNVSLGFRL